MKTKVKTKKEEQVKETKSAKEQMELEVVKDEYIEGEWNAIYEEREEKLQGGTSVGTQEEA